MHLEKIDVSLKYSEKETLNSKTEAVKIWTAIRFIHLFNKNEVVISGVPSSPHREVQVCGRN